jgi:hypothetical protein
MAVHREGGSIMLPEPLWAAAGIEQDRRTIRDPWIDEVANVAASAVKYQRQMDKHPQTADDALGVVYEANAERERVTSQYVLRIVLGIPTDRMSTEHGQRLGRAMRAHGWKGPNPLWIGGRTVKGYERTGREPWDVD